MAYATPTDLAQYYDGRVIADLASDSDAPVADITADPKVLAILSAASGRVDSALTVANHYRPENLATMIADAGDAAALLKWLVATIAIAMLLSRRPGSRYEERYRATVKDAEDFLDRLRKGERVFGEATAQRDAGLPSVDGPTTVDYDRLNLLPDRTRHFYPSRGSRLPLGRQ